MATQISFVVGAVGLTLEEVNASLTHQFIKQSGSSAKHTNLIHIIRRGEETFDIDLGVYYRAQGQTYEYTACFISIVEAEASQEAASACSQIYAQQLYRTLTGILALTTAQLFVQSLQLKGSRHPMNQQDDQ